MYHKLFIKQQGMGKIVFGALLGVLFTMLFFYFFLPDFHHVKTVKPQVLGFESVSIRPNDTLWDIAEKYYSDEYGSVPDYVDEIKRCNSLTNDHIKSGTSIIVPIYVAPKKELAANQQK